MRKPKKPKPIKGWTKLNHEELNERVWEVFLMEAGETCNGVEVVSKTKKVKLYIEDATGTLFAYEPNMDQRPEALAYIMGYRNDFND